MKIIQSGFESLKRQLGKSSFYETFSKVLFTIKIKYLLFTARFYHRAELKKVRKEIACGGQAIVVFLVSDKSIWKTDSLYWEMEGSDSFFPQILVIPRLSATDMVSTSEDTYQYFRSKGYRVTNAYVEGCWQDITTFFEPDLIFISNPHKITLQKYSIGNLYKNLVYYVPYFEQIDTNYELHFNSETENLAYRIFQINHIHKLIAAKHAINSGKNIVVTGYMATETLYEQDLESENPWRRPDLKNIVLAPHHSIESADRYSKATFIKNSEILKSLPDLFEGRVSFAFKPHPLLKDKLYAHPQWGKVKTDEYWSFWQNHNSSQLEEGGYVDLFRNSDALIHDCSSFLLEYLYVNRPCLYLNPDVRETLNEYGQIGFDLIQKADKEDDIVEFVESVVSGLSTLNSPEVLAKIIPRESPLKSVMRDINASLEISHD